MGEKSAVIKSLEQLPEEAILEDIQYHLYVLQKIKARQGAGILYAGTKGWILIFLACLRISVLSYQTCIWSSISIFR